MDIMKSQANMMWIDMPHHHVTRFKLFKCFTDCKSLMACHDKNTCCDLIIYIYDFLKQNILKIFITIIHVLYIIFIYDTSMYVHITYINAQIHTTTKCGCSLVVLVH